jgi:biotin carboxylase
MSLRRVLVVGTTSDYIDIISHRFPDRALFVTDTRERATATEASPPSDSEVLTDLANPGQVIADLRQHLREYGIEASGITCFDCESMLPAAKLAGVLSLDYHSPEAVTLSRSKFASKERWLQDGISCPKTKVVGTLTEAVEFLQQLKRPAVIKPLTGSGSELVFLCNDKYDCTTAFRTMSARLAEPSNPRMYMSAENGQPDSRHLFVMEEFIHGREYSSDFVVDGDRIDIIRIARKIPAEDQPLGTTLAYVVPGKLPGGISIDRLKEQLHRAARAIGLSRAICMVDFIVRDDKAYLLEMTPRPGGDCLPPLLRQSSGLDILGYALDFAEHRETTLPEPSKWHQLVGLRLFAEQGGVIRSIDTERVRSDRRVREVCLKRSPGHRVELPPQDYDSRILGHVIFAPSRPDDIEAECLELLEMVSVEMEISPWTIPTLS